jgi:hypothetical protein
VALFQGQVEEARAARDRDQQRAAEIARRDFERESAARKADYELAKVVHDARVEVAKSSIERARTAAEFVRNAAAGIVTIYTGVLGVAFATGDGSRALPARGIVPAVFLALSLVLATAYVAFFTRGPNTKVPLLSSSLPLRQEQRIRTFSAWVFEGIWRRATLLRAAVISLGAGAATLPAPFVQVHGWQLWVTVATALVAVVVTALWRREGDSPHDDGAAKRPKS